MSRTRIEDGLMPAKGNGATKLPSGTDAQRPTNPPNPSIRFNTTEEVFEMYDGQWRALNQSSHTVDVDYLVIAGGGSGNPGGGGGGAGGYRTSYGTGNVSGRNSAVESSLTFNSGVQYTITVGAGGATMSVSSDTATLNAGGNTGANSSISGSDITTITSLGGGCASYYPTSGYLAKNNGGCGGGAVFGSSGGHNQGNTSGTSGQGFGGHGGDVSSASTWSGGGGGAGAAGNNTGTGGVGLDSSITGTSVNRAGGGSPGPWSGGSRGSNGFGGGSAPGGAGTANTGGGGGGGGSTSQSQSNLRASGNGGSGVVILRLPTAKYSGTTTGSPTISTDGTDTILTFTSSGTYTA